MVCRPAWFTIWLVLLCWHVQLSLLRDACELQRLQRCLCVRNVDCARISHPSENESTENGPRLVANSFVWPTCTRNCKLVVTSILTPKVDSCNFFCGFLIPLRWALRSVKLGDNNTFKIRFRRMHSRTIDGAMLNAIFCLLWLWLVWFFDLAIFGYLKREDST